MHLSISARFTLKDRPKEHRGLTGETWAFGRTGFISLAAMCCGVIQQIMHYYEFLCDADTLNADLDRLVDWLQGVRFRDGPPDPGVDYETESA